MKSICSYFDKVYCINLEERTDRWDSCLEKFKEYGIVNFKRFEGIKVNGNLSSKKLGQIGCSASFYNILKDARDKNYNNILILEDDFNFTVSKDEMSEALGKAFEEMPKDWDMFYLGANIVNEIMHNPIEKYSENLFKLNSAYTTHSICFSKNSFDKILNFFQSEENWVENLMTNYESIDVFFAKDFHIANKCFIWKDLLCLQEPSFSSIENTFYNYTDQMLKNFNYFKSIL
jgi:GR25 family glycosyltransferase involved in LPS biosynthesis